MASSKHPNEANPPALTNQKPETLDKPSPKPNSSDKATHGSLTSTSAGSGQGPTTVLQGRGGSGGGSGEASSDSGQREASALHKWLEQTPRDEPWRPGR
ncbi:hypothetical protein HO133_007085 [Letharia lupina]|uniref:Uncharacterized protein n=1 Tax=Letharia lupina TaxID=560253 RepID=A0A8H6FI66_9LECA|nr:uncharacterized protein HO133_007085 [Letharia lupina]KAF6228972.1 hypothetical protein HO133_007085 [Letharia lupina]